MKTAQPASLPPGVCGSGGISRATSASTAAPSSGVKYTHAPGRTGVGGAPAFGAQGKLPLTIRARAEVVEKNNHTAVVASSSRRLRSEPDDRRPDVLDVPSLSAAGSACRRVWYWKWTSVTAMGPSAAARALYFLSTLTPEGSRTQPAAW